MAVWSKAQFKNTIAADRMDAEFFQPKFMEAERKLLINGAVPLRRLLVDICYGLNVPPEYTESGLPFLRALNLKESSIEGEILNIPFTPEDIGEDNLLKNGDVLVVRSGANVGDIGVITPSVAGGTFGSYIIRLQTHNVDPFYLAVFLKSAFGRIQTVRFRSGTAQPNISIPNLKEVLVFVPSPDQQAKIRDLYFLSQDAIKQSAALYAEAETLLLDALGLSGVDLSHQLTYQRNFKEVARAGRFDAQYFQPKYQRAMKIMACSGKSIGDVASLASRRFKPRSGETFQYIEIGSLTGTGHAHSETVWGEDAPSRAQSIVQTNDIITSTVRPIRRLSALIQPDQNGFVCSSGFVVLEPHSIEPELLLLYLRLPLVSEVLDLHTATTMYPSIAPDVLMSIPISQPSSNDAKAIVGKVQQAHIVRQRAAQLLEEAKQKVEDLILGAG